MINRSNSEIARHLRIEVDSIIEDVSVTPRAETLADRILKAFPLEDQIFDELKDIPYNMRKRKWTINCEVQPMPVGLFDNEEDYTRHAEEMDYLEVSAFTSHKPKLEWSWYGRFNQGAWADWTTTDDRETLVKRITQAFRIIFPKADIIVTFTTTPYDPEADEENE